MNRRTLIVATGAVALAGFAVAGSMYDRPAPQHAAAVLPGADYLVRPHSPVVGRAEAPVTLVEFFDPSCEACRALHPIVKQILAQHPDDVRLVLRYAPFHEGSDEAVRILETARLQGVFEPVLDNLLRSQPVWAKHGAPNLKVAWFTAAAAGLNTAQAERDKARPEIEALLRQDKLDVALARVAQTPTFFVNGKPLPSFGPQQLVDLVNNEVAKARSTRAGS